MLAASPSSLYESAEILNSSAGSGGGNQFNVDAFAGVQRSVALGSRKATLKVQLIVRNLTNEEKVQGLRYNANHSGLFRIYFVDPRSYCFLVGLDL